MELEKYTLGSLKKAVLDGDIKSGSVMAGLVVDGGGEVEGLAAALDLADGVRVVLAVLGDDEAGHLVS